ncbi:MAG: apolipoprotein N-acyltransferase [Rikenellaceae bacterium]
MLDFIYKTRFFLLSILSALALSIGFLQMSGLAMMLGFVPLFYISHSIDKGRRGFWRFFFYVAVALGLWSGLTTWWIWYAAPIGAILSVIITVCMMGSAFMVFHYVSKRAPLSLSYTIFVSLWISLEYLYTVGEISFPWIMLGNGLANDIYFIQWYEFTGVFGGSLWVLVANILFWELFKCAKKSKAVITFAWIFVPIFLSEILFFTHDIEGESVNIQVVQPNVDPYNAKFTTSVNEQAENLVALAYEAPDSVDFIITPETSISDRVWENYLPNNPMIKFMDAKIFEKYPSTQLVLGATTYRRYRDGVEPSATARVISEGDYYDVYNSAIVMDSTGVEDVHHKSKLVVGVEKMPYYNLTKHLKFLIVDLGGTTGQMGVDSEPKVFSSNKGVKFSTAICYESVYGAYFSEFVKRGAELVFIITNDGWWHDTPGYRQHFSFARIRAIETRRAIARSANTGISGFINQRGEVLEQSKWDEKVSLNGELVRSSKLSFYTLYGDVIARVCVYTFLLCAMYFVAYSFRKKSHLN